MFFETLIPVLEVLDLHGYNCLYLLSLTIELISNRQFDFFDA